MAQADQISIYRLDPERLEGKIGQAAFDLILQTHDEKEAVKAQRKKGYQPKRFGLMEDSFYHDPQTDSDVAVGVYFHKKSYQHKLASFLRGVAPGSDLDKLNVQNCDVLVLLPFGNEVYAFTSGTAHHVISAFVDDGFPIEVAKRLLDPEKIKQTKERLLIGSLYARDRYFRRSHRIAASEAFGRVWKMVLGTIKKEAVLEYGLDELFEEETELTCEVRNAFKVNKRVSFVELCDLIRKLDTLRRAPLTDEQKQTFGFLNSVKQVPSKNQVLISKLNETLLRKAYAVYLDPAAPLDFDFCHVEYDRYLSSDEVMVHLSSRGGNFAGVQPFEDARAVMRHLAKAFSWTTFAEFETDAKHYLWVSSINRENPSNGTIDQFLEHFHGEISVGGKSYFLIDGNWYSVTDDFFDRLNLDFKDLLKRPANIITRADSPLLSWNPLRRPGYAEADFNEDHKDKKGYIVCDRITPYGIELCDVMILREKELLLVHNKVGLGASVRDVCSQILNAARSIQESIKSADKGIIRDYYRLIVSYTGTDPYRLTTKANVSAIGEDAFINLFTSKTLIFVLGFLDDAVTERILDATTADAFGSNIARFEIVTLFENMRSVDPELKICQIYKG